MRKLRICGLTPVGSVNTAKLLILETHELSQAFNRGYIFRMLSKTLGQTNHVVSNWHLVVMLWKF